MDSGLGIDLLTGVWGEVREREGSIVIDRISCGKVLSVSSLMPIEHVQGTQRATWNTDMGKEKWASDFNFGGEGKDRRESSWSKDSKDSKVDVCEHALVIERSILISISTSIS